MRELFIMLFFFFNDTATTEIYTLSLHDALPISGDRPCRPAAHSSSSPSRSWLTLPWRRPWAGRWGRSEEHTSELQSRLHLVCRLLLEKKNKTRYEGPVMSRGWKQLCRDCADQIR